MKKIFALILVFCLVLGISSAALAAGAPKIIKQPTSQTTNKKGSVTFTFSARNYDANESGWRFVNPATGEEYTGPQMRDLLKEYKGTLTVSEGKKKLVLTKVPESMHGWDVYFVLVNNGYTIYTDRVKLWCYGLPQTEATPSDIGAEVASVPAEQPAEQPVEQPVEQPAEQPVEQPADSVVEIPADPLVEEPVPDEPEVPAEPQIVTVSASDKLTLIPLDARGNEITDQAASILTFEDSGSLAVHSESPVRYWIINGMRIEPSETVNSFVLKNVTADLAVSAKFEKSSSAPTEVDPNQPCQVTCSGCVFTYHGGNLNSVSSGSVPLGASIIVTVAAGADVSGGYTVNGESGLHAGYANFRLTIEGDTVISVP